MAPAEELFSQWSLWMVNLCPQFYAFYLNYSISLAYIYMCGSGSTSLVEMFKAAHMTAEASVPRFQSASFTKILHC